MTMLLTFLVPGDRAAGPLGRAVVELGLRIGLPFRARAEGQGPLPSEGWVLACGGAALPDGARGLAEPLGQGPSIAEKLGERLVFGPRADGGLDVITGAARLLSFDEERAAPRDAMGRVVAATHPLAVRGLLLDPMIESAAAHLLDRLRAAGLTGARPVPVFGGRRVVSLTHDTDGPRLHDAFQLGRAALRGLRHAPERRALAAGLSTLATGRRDPYWNFDGWRALAEASGGRSTFYVYPGPTEGVARHPRDPRYDPARGPYPAALRALAEAGFEVGIHYAIETDSAAQHATEASRIAGITGVAPRGGRAHYWRIDWSDPHGAWDRMAAGGLEYDASLSPMALGYRTGTMLPVLGGALDATRPPATPFLVLPSPVMDAYIDPARPDGPGPGQADRLVANAAGGGLVVLNWHVRTLGDTGPWQGFGREARRILGELATDGDTVFMTAADVAQAWRARIAALWHPA